MACPAVSTEDLSSVHSVLEQFSLSRFHIEYETFKTNHLLHVLVALHFLGAKQQRLVEFAEKQTQLYDPAHPTEGPLSGDDWKLLLGQKKRFVELREFFRGELKTRGRDGVVSHYVPQMIDGGLGCAAFHPLIHIGYGIVGGTDGDVADGLAYMVFQHRPTQSQLHTDAIEQLINDPSSLKMPQFVSQPPASPGSDLGELLSHPVCKLLRTVRADERLQRFITYLKEQVWERIPEFVSKTGFGPFSGGQFLIKDNILDIINQYVDDSHLFDVGNDVELGKLVDALYQGILIVYASTDIPDDFFVLHGLTSALALRELLPILPDFSTRLKAVRTFARDVVTAYINRAMRPLVPWTVPDDLPTWEEIKERTVADADEHLIKVVFTCDRMEKEYGELLCGARVYRAVAAFKCGILPWPRTQNRGRVKHSEVYTLP